MIPALIITFLIVGSLIIIPLIVLNFFENRLNRQSLILHVIFNSIFIVWSIYDLGFTYHYGHGPNTLFIIFPGWFALGIYYLFISGYFFKGESQEYKLFRRYMGAIYLVLFAGFVAFDIVSH